jgi:sugar phosphate isomerase/epimerase
MQMRLAISNIAWNVSEDEQVAGLLNRYDVDAIDIAPGKYFPQPSDASRHDVDVLKQWWAGRGIEITGMQALLFGTTGLNVFGSNESQEALLRHLKAVCRIGGLLGAPRLVFGSPKNRDRTGLSDLESLDRARVFFRRLGEVAEAHGVIICLEPNPACYGANFMTTSATTAEVVRAVAHSSIRMQLDTGAMTINDENPMMVTETCMDIAGHIHASEPNLVPLGDGGTDHDAMFVALSRYLPDNIVSIEMVATDKESHLVSVERALKVAVGCYRARQD